MGAKPTKVLTTEQVTNLINGMTIDKNFNAAKFKTEQQSLENTYYAASDENRIIIGDNIKKIITVFCDEDCKKQKKDVVDAITPFTASFFDQADTKKIDTDMKPSHNINEKRTTGLKTRLEKEKKKKSVHTQKTSFLGNLSTPKIETEEAAKKILLDIQTKLSRLDTIPDKITEETKEIELDNVKYSAECLLNFFSQKTFFVNTKCEDDKIKNYTKLFNKKLNKNNITEDTNYYYKLYGLNIEMVRQIANNTNKFSSLTNTNKERILSRVQDFIANTLKFLGKLMNNDNVIDNSLLKSSYNLMYLMNHMTRYQISLGASIKEISNSYQQIEKLIKENIKLYNQIISDKNLKNLPTIETMGKITEADTLISRLKNKNDELKKQQDDLKNRKEEIENMSDQLKVKIDSEDIKKLAEKFKVEIQNIPKEIIKQEPNANVQKSDTNEKK